MNNECRVSSVLCLRTAERHQESSYQVHFTTVNEGYCIGKRPTSEEKLSTKTKDKHVNYHFFLFSTYFLHSEDK